MLDLEAIGRGYSLSVAQRCRLDGRTLFLLLPCLVGSMRVSVCERQQSRFLL